MARQLNQDLFTQPLQPSAEKAFTIPGVETKPDPVHVLESQVDSLYKRLKEFESRLEVMTAKNEEMLQQNKQRFERVQGHFQRQNEMMKSGFQEIHQKIAQIASRVNERRVEEGVVKEMVERHAHVVQTFEVRMQQLQRLISEQELQLMNARSELKEALGELARLKRL